MAITARYVKNLLKDQILPIFSGPVLVIVHYRIPLSLKIKTKVREPRHGFPHTMRPDGDNLEKFINDSLNGIIWSDDSRIVWSLRSKTFTTEKEGQTIIFVRELANDKPDYALILSDINNHIRLEEAV